jgi:hypothetical protein
MDPGQSFSIGIPHPSLSPRAILAGGKLGAGNLERIIDKKIHFAYIFLLKERVPPYTPHGGEIRTACMGMVKRNVWKECPIRELVNEFVKVKRSCSQGVNSLQDDLAFPGLLGSPVHYPPRPKQTGGPAIALLWRILGIPERCD